MKIENAIGWCDETTNAVTGCDKVSPGCKNCYAATGTRARVLRAKGIETWGPNGVRHPVAQFAEKIWRLNKLCVCNECHTAGYIGRMRNGIEIAPGNECGVAGCHGMLRRPRLFADSNSDWLDDKWTIETLANLLKEIHDAPNVDVLLLTKRPENFAARLYDALWQLEGLDPNEDTDEYECKTPVGKWVDDWIHGGTPPGVWLGVSVENQAMADLRIPQLLKIPAAVRFLSCEPLLENIRIFDALRCDVPIHWVIVGGESGTDRRDCGVAAIVDVAEQCGRAGVACYVKQDCAFKSGEQGRIPDEVWRMKQFPKTVLRELH